MVAIIIHNPVYAYVKESQGITVFVSDYGIRGQRHVLPEAGINAQDLVNKGIYPIKISVTNKSNELVTLSAESVGLVQQDYNVILKKIGGLSTRHILAICTGTVLGILSLGSLREGVVHNAWNREDKFNGIVGSVIYGVGSAACFVYAWYDSSKINEKLAKSLADLGLKGTVSIEPGASMDRFIFIDQTTYNQINMCNIILTKAGNPIAFQMPLD